MKQQIYDSEYVNFHLDASKGIMYEKWTDVSHDDEVYKKVMLDKCDLIRKYSPKFVVDDVSQTDFTIVPELQEWTENTLGPVLVEVGVTKYAVVVPESLFGQVSLDQTVDEIVEAQGEVQEGEVKFEYFDDTREAEKWIMGEN